MAKKIEKLKATGWEAKPTMKDNPKVKADVDKLKKEKTKEELLEIATTNPNTGKYTILERTEARRALDELKVSYDKSFK